MSRQKAVAHSTSVRSHSSAAGKCESFVGAKKKQDKLTRIFGAEAKRILHEAERMSRSKNAQKSSSKKQNAKAVRNKRSAR